MGPYSERVLRYRNENFVHFYRVDTSSGKWLYILRCTDAIVTYNSRPISYFSRTIKIYSSENTDVLEYLCPICQRLYLMHQLGE